MSESLKTSDVSLPNKPKVPLNSGLDLLQKGPEYNSRRKRTNSNIARQKDHFQIQFLIYSFLFNRSMLENNLKINVYIMRELSLNVLNLIQRFRKKYIFQIFKNKDIICLTYLEYLTETQK